MDRGVRVFGNLEVFREVVGFYEGFSLDCFDLE